MNRKSKVIKLQKPEDDWFVKYKDLEAKIIEKNGEIRELKEKEKQLKRELALALQK